MSEDESVWDLSKLEEVWARRRARVAARGRLIDRTGANPAAPQPGRGRMARGPRGASADGGDRHATQRAGEHAAAEQEERAVTAYSLTEGTEVTEGAPP